MKYTCISKCKLYLQSVVEIRFLTSRDGKFVNVDFPGEVRHAIHGGAMHISGQESTEALERLAQFLGVYDEDKSTRPPILVLRIR
jgi:hypothetical protein